MAFCIYCGQQLPDGAVFCSKCGKQLVNTGGETSSATPVASLSRQSTTTQIDDGRCPNCGSNLGRFEAVCPYCGTQITNRESSYTVRQFASELAKIEAEAHERSGSGLMKSLGLTQMMEKSYGNKAFDRKISLINSFPIPNTIEEITEFVLLAVANIDVRYGKKSFSNRLYGRPGATYYTDVKLANTWISKMEQAYNKAEMSFADDPMFPKVQRVYMDKMRELGYKK